MTETLRSKGSERIPWRRMLYILCFFIIHVVDWVLNTQAGDRFRTAICASGVVMFFLILSAGKISKKELFNRMSGLWTLLCAGVDVLALFRIDPGRDTVHGIYLWTFVWAVVNVWWIGLVCGIYAVRFLRDPASRPHISWRGWGAAVMLLLMTFSKGGKIWPLWYLFLFGLFYLTRFEKKDLECLAESVVDGTILAFFVGQIFCYGFRPYDNENLRYVGAFVNCNTAALHYLLVYVTVLVKLHILHRKKAALIWKIIFAIGAGGLLGFQLMTIGRTAWVISFLVTAVYGVVVLRRQWEERWGKIVLRGAVLMVLTAVLLPVVFGTVRWLPTILHHPVWFLDEYSVKKVHSFDPPDSEKYVEWDELMDGILGRIKSLLPIRAENPFVLRVQAMSEVEPGSRLPGVSEDGTVERDIGISTRFYIYRMYWNDLRWNGHTVSEGHYPITSYYMAWHAHNLWLQAAYYYGIPAGVLLILLTVALLLVHLRTAWRKNTPAVAILPLFVCMVFFGYGIMECVWNVGQAVLFLVFLVQHPGFAAKESV